MKLRRERFKGSRILFRPCVVGSKREDNARVDVIIMDAIFLSFDVKKKTSSHSAEKEGGGKLFSVVVEAFDGPFLSTSPLRYQLLSY